MSDTTAAGKATERSEDVSTAKPPAITPPTRPSAWDMSKEGSWSMSHERQFIETVLNQRFNFFLLFYALVLNAAIQSKAGAVVRATIYIWGLLIAFPLALTILRSDAKLSHILGPRALWQSGSDHASKFIDDIAGEPGSKSLVSMRHLIGKWIPLACCASLAALAAHAASHAWFGNPVSSCWFWR